MYRVSGIGQLWSCLFISVTDFKNHTEILFMFFQHNEQNFAVMKTAHKNDLDWRRLLLSTGHKYLIICT